MTGTSWWAAVAVGAALVTAPPAAAAAPVCPQVCAPGLYVYRISTARKLVPAPDGGYRVVYVLTETRRTFWSQPPVPAAIPLSASSG
ncbi:hypothetical protein [Amycolatopsis nalaikhensis]|uniref:Secreted protein n=1 Tax=Amycolatopsis nalaikhensis TaxID=715472 RepID=A0ABY8XIT1_9PSEU|nr:hypothetical protein [Amycolatopsis sp. 2-2]WIV55545.1 hypothetical protein QP939_43135 [Amycolatopsis sp. 2-2]